VLVSILINNYNYGEFLRDAIDSALAQTYRDTEVVVVDDGSTDNSRDIIASYGDRIRPVLKPNGGQASTFNAAFAASHGEIVCMLDSDDLFLSDKVEQIVRVFQSDAAFAWCFDRLQWVDRDLRPVPGEVKRGVSGECDHRSDVKRGKLYFTAPATSGLSFRRSFLAQLMPLPESEGLGISDEYLKVASLGLTKGYYLAVGYTLQRIHGRNAYTARPEKERLNLKSFIQLRTACELGTNFPDLRNFANKLYAKAVAMCWLSGGMNQQQRAISSAYLSSTPARCRPLLFVRSACHLVRLSFQLRRHDVQASAQARLKPIGTN
jgi:glycosyltransferase involved in cell wall biosynthesis